MLAGTTDDVGDELQVSYCVGEVLNSTEQARSLSATPSQSTSSQLQLLQLTDAAVVIVIHN